jgi:four helix bundle protein
VARVKDHRDLIVWRKAMGLARAVYAATQNFPWSEVFGLQSQIRRAAVSIPANIAEGHGRLTDMQFRHFLGNARGSLCELQTELELARDLGFVEGNPLEALMQDASEVARLLNALIAVMPANKTTAGGRTKTSSADTANSASTGQS